MSDSARIIMTFKCDKACPGCANTYGSVMGKAQPLYSVRQLKNYKNLVISGGEPMLYPERTLKLVQVLKKWVPQAKLFLYTAYYRNAGDIEKILPYIDGVNYTVHKEANEKDIKEFYEFQQAIKKFPNKNFRLYVDAAIGDKVKIDQDAWDRAKVAPWMTEPEMMASGGCPEDLFYLGTPEKKHKVPPAGPRPKGLSERIRFCECCNTFRLEESTPKFSDIVWILTAVRMLNSGVPIDKVAVQAKVTPQKIRGKLRAAGFRQAPSGQWMVAESVNESADDLFSMPTTTEEDRNKENIKILKSQLSKEQEYLRVDRDRYLECLNGKPLKDRKTAQEIRDGLILYWNVYLRGSRKLLGL